LFGQAIAGKLTAPEFVGCRELGNRALAAFDEIELDDFVTVGGVGEFQPKDLSVAFGLLQAIGGGTVRSLRLHHGDAQVRTVPQQIIRAFAGAPMALASRSDDPPVSESYLLIEPVRIGVPTSGLELRNDELPACVGFVWHEGPKVTDRTVPNKPL